MKKRAVSEVIGTLILVGVVMVGITLVGILLLSNPLPAKIPVFDSIISNQSKTIYIYHKGGDALYRGQYSILVDGGDQTANFTIMSPGTEPWAVGETLTNTTPTMPKHVVIVFNQGGLGGSGTVIGEADLVGTVSVIQAQNQGNWYFNQGTSTCNWAYRKKIIINHSQVTADQTGFPVLISLSADPDLSAHALANGSDILFTSSDGMTKIFHESENYTSGNLVAWVNIQTLPSSTDTVLYMYYGNASSTPQQNPNAVWTNSYVGVWHLNGTPADGVKGYVDSTGNGNTGTPTGFSDGGGGSKGAPGMADGAVNFANENTGTTNMVNISDSPSLRPNGDMTVEGWISMTNPITGSDNQLVYKQVNGGYSYKLAIEGSGPRYAGFFWDNNAASEWEAQSTTPILPNTWYYIAGVKSGTSVQMFVNGNNESTVGGATGTIYLGAGAINFNMGAAWTHGGGLNGILDEVRFSSVARSPSWISTEYNNLKPSSLFYSVGSEEKYWKC